MNVPFLAKVVNRLEFSHTKSKRVCVNQGEPNWIGVENTLGIYKMTRLTLLW